MMPGITPADESANGAVHISLGRCPPIGVDDRTPTGFCIYSQGALPLESLIFILGYLPIIFIALQPITST